MGKAIQEILKESLRGKIIQCPCEDEPTTFLFLGHIGNSGFSAFDLDTGKYEDVKFSDFWCKGIALREISPLNLTPSQANFVAFYEKEHGDVLKVEEDVEKEIKKAEADKIVFRAARDNSRKEFFEIYRKQVRRGGYYWPSVP